MELRAGYKQTEVGVIPEDWELLPFEAVLRKIGARRHQIQTSEYLEFGTFPVVDQGQKPVVAFSERKDKVHKTPDNGVIVFGDHTCIFKYVDFDFVVGADGTQVLATKGNHSTRFHAFDLDHRGVNSTGYNRHFKFLKERLFLSPPPAEQLAISAALSDAHALIASLDALIAKKRDLKQAAMQQLLTGKTRLPGFTGEWEVKRLGELLEYEQPTKYLVSSKDYDDSFDIPVLTAGKTFVLGRTNETQGIFEDLPVIIFDDFTTASKFVDFPFKAKSSAMKILRPRHKDVNIGVVYELMQMVDFVMTDHKRYWISEFQKIEVEVPRFKEQTAIAEVLGDMDADLSALEAQRDKARAIKQGMTQELLTGRIRLV